jgi:histidinol-phosphate aminotransferase
VDSLAQLAGEAAFAADDWFRQTRASIIQSREELTAGLEKRAFQVLPSKANFVFARHAEKKGIDLYTQLRAGGVLVRHFNQARISDFLRITVGTPDQIEATLSLLDQILV